MMEPNTQPMVDPLIMEQLAGVNLEVIEAQSLYDLIDEDMNFPDWD